MVKKNQYCYIPIFFLLSLHTSPITLSPVSHLARRQVLKSEQRDLVVGADLVVVGWVGERQRQHALLLQVGLVDPGEIT